MKRIIFLSFLASIFFTSCQREVNIELDRITNDSTAHLTPMFKVVQIDQQGGGQDSIIHIFTAVTINGERSVIESKIDPFIPGDTINTLFTYNQQNQLINMKVTSSTAPAVVLANYQFIWNGTRLMRVVGDSLGQFVTSFDFLYTPSGSNTAITTVQVPSLDWIDPGLTVKYKHKVTVNGQFRPVEEQWIQHTHVIMNPLPENHHDTTNIYYNYSGNDLASYNGYYSGADTNSATGWPTNFHRDTTLTTYSRAASGANIADTIRKVYGNDVYTLMNFSLLYFSYAPAWTFTEGREEKLFYSRPFSTVTNSVRSWWNGIFDSANSYTNQLWEKNDNTFDAQGRLTKSDFYDNAGMTLVYTLKIYYY